jgi:N-acetylglucosamine kinase-like BadF-type ATPase
MTQVLGVDAGGTKTIAVIADSDGQISSIGKAGCANFQICGTAGAGKQLQLAIEQATSQAGVELDQLDGICFGISGADRPKDFKTIEKMIASFTSTKKYRLENDTIIALRAGTKDGVGIALIAGTGANAIGRTAEGVRLQIGGLGELSGDFAASSQIGLAATIAAVMSQDGRGDKTVLEENIKQHYQLDHIYDIMEYTFYDSDKPPFVLGAIAPLVFEAAASGDQVAVNILTRTGKEVARSVIVILDKLFTQTKNVNIVFGGSVFQKGVSPKMIETVIATTQAHRSDTNFVKLETQPVLGALGFAFDDLGWKLDSGLWQKLSSNLENNLSSENQSANELQQIND